MNSKNYQQVYSQDYQPEIEERVQNLSTMEFKWLNILKKIPKDDLEALKKQFEKQQISLKEIQKQSDKQKIEEK
ncbi:unnamed protein product [Paramecium sonneborni]|uniref:Uncharacterized protein n=1 Tax=Paramecium sonneborni TaxID=65129 RepID=A0A8S1MPU4_9CILI|nr:unnamed protein product [Paramecium sonneborni]